MSTLNAQNTSPSLIWTTDSTANLLFQTANTTALMIDGNQNLGVGVTPSAWITGQGKVIEVGYVGNSFWGRYANENHLGQNYYNNSSGVRTYASTNPASDYQQYNGTHTWYTAPSGTAGNTIPFTQAMTLTNAGTLQFGVSGQGVQFTNSSALTNSTLNDYETGTWTPTYTNLTVNSGTNTSTGTYTKIGNIVTCSFNLYNSGGTNTVTANSTRVIFPFTFGTGGYTSPIFWGVFGNVSSSAASGGLQSSTAGTASGWITANITAAWISGTITYQASF